MDNAPQLITSLVRVALRQAIAALLADIFGGGEP
jgi:hypothetical protein